MRTLPLRHRRADRLIACLAGALLVGGGSLPGALLAQSPDAPSPGASPAEVELDLISPTIEHEQARPGIAGTSQRFEARVRDNVGLDTVTLFHRRAGEDDFADTAMRDVGGDRHVATVTPADERPGAIEYFIEAVDLAGTRTTRGSRGAPLERVLDPAPAPPPEPVSELDVDAASESEPALVLDVEPEASPATAPGIVIADTPVPAESAEEPRSRRTLWYVVGGVVLTGVALALSGGGGSDSDPGCDGTCSITFLIDAPR